MTLQKKNLFKTTLQNIAIVLIKGLQRMLRQYIQEISWNSRFKHVMLQSTLTMHIINVDIRLAVYFLKVQMARKEA